MPPIKPLSPNMLPELARFWNAAFPDQALTEFLLAERVFGPRDASPENSLCYLDDQGGIIALSLIVPPGPKDPETGSRVGGIRWFGVHPERRGAGLGHRLMEESCARLAAAGATAVDFLATPPFYIQPGVDVRQTSVIAWLLRQGFEHVRTNFNMTVDLEIFQAPSPEEIFSPDKKNYAVRRAKPEDADAFARYCLRDWTANWKEETSQGLTHDPVSLFLAVLPRVGKTRSSPHSPQTPGEEEIVGFASYETGQCLGTFGPTGVSPGHRGNGLGRRLLYATLADMQALGRRSAQIGWVGPVDFYHRAAGAVIGPVFWAMRKRLGNA